MAAVKKITTRMHVENLQPYPYWLDNDDNGETLPAIFKDLEDYLDDEMSFDLNYVLNEDRSFNISFSLSLIRYTCGIVEMGELSITKDFPQKAFNELMLTILSNLKGKTLIINTNGKGSSIYYEILLSKCKYFVKVKQFINPATKNIITMWVSNN